MPAQGTKIPHTMWNDQIKRKEKKRQKQDFEIYACNRKEQTI